MQRINHEQLANMPDIPGVCRDHDNRYVLRKSKADISYLDLLERSVDPDDPVEGHAVIWLSDGTGSGEDGDIMVKVTAGGSTRSGTLIDFDVDLT